MTNKVIFRSTSVEKHLHLAQRTDALISEDHISKNQQSQTLNSQENVDQPVTNTNTDDTSDESDG